jgi:glucosamine-6-phosphate deaminase
MEIIVQPKSEAATNVAARLIARLLREKPDAVLGLATGSTPLRLYQTLVKMKLDWRRVTTFNLDEYVGLPPQHAASYHSVMEKNFLRHINIARKNIHIPDGMTKNVPVFCERYEKQIRASGGIDLQLLGIGTIMEARHCLLLAFGRNKARAVAEAAEGPITARNPASVLQMHPRVTVCLDKDAASRLEMTEYYRWVYANKPDWQKV